MNHLPGGKIALQRAPATSASGPFSKGDAGSMCIIANVMRMQSSLVVALFLGGCAPSIAARASGHCDPPVRATLHFDADPAPPANAPREERLAALLGLRAALLELRASNALTVESRLRVLERIELARLSVSATSAELDCEGERADQTAAYLAHRETSTVQGLTVASIAVAAGTAIAGVLLSTRNASAASQDIVGISGGAVTAGLGLASLSVHPRIAYAHPRNLLTDIWKPPAQTSTFSPLAWAYLTQPEFSNEQNGSIREKIVTRWRRFQGIEHDPADLALLFGAGGSYDADLLRTRAQMLDEVKAEVDLANQDLEVLAAELIR